MSRSRRFPVAIHTLSLLAVKPEKHFSSDLIARSVGTNSVVIRRVLSMLHKAGMIACQAGVGGGAKLAVSPKELSLLEIYRAVEASELFALHKPQPECPVACALQTELVETMKRLENAMFQEMSNITLDQFSKVSVEAYVEWQQEDCADGTKQEQTHDEPSVQPIADDEHD